MHTKAVVAYYEEEDQDLDKVLHVFIRTNSGGTKLSYSDMLMSMATAQWETLDARAEIHGKVDEINDMGGGFGFSQDFLLKAGLMLAGVTSVGFRVTNFTRSNMKLLEERWDRITWIATFERRAAREYAQHHDLGDVPADITGFNAFYEARRARLLSRLRRLLGTDRRERGSR